MCPRICGERATLDLCLLRRYKRLQHVEEVLSVRWVVCILRETKYFFSSTFFFRNFLTTNRCQQLLPPQGPVTYRSPDKRLMIKYFCVCMYTNNTTGDGKHRNNRCKVQYGQVGASSFFTPGRCIPVLSEVYGVYTGQSCTRLPC